MADDIAHLQLELLNFDPRMKRRIKTILDRGARQLETFAKTNARWTDRTGLARQTLHASAYDSPNQYDPGLPAGAMGMQLSHGMPYGIWLEVRWHGRYAIILLSIQTIGPQVMRTMELSLLNSRDRSGTG